MCEDGSSSTDPTTVPNPPTVNSEAVQSHSPGSNRLNLDEEVHNLYVGSKTAITTAKKQKLVELYAYLSGAEIEECKKLTRDQLLRMIFDLVSSTKLLSPISINVSDSAQRTKSQVYVQLFCIPQCLNSLPASARQY